jgi:hypothetical protein
LLQETQAAQHLADRLRQRSHARGLFGRPAGAAIVAGGAARQRQFHQHVAQL